jgi:hypothetical protein
MLYIIIYVLYITNYVLAKELSGYIYLRLLSPLLEVNRVLIQ